MQITPRAGESAVLSIVHSLRPFLSFPIQELSLVPFSTMRAREEAVSAHRSLCRQRLGWAARFLPALCPLTPPAHPPLTNGWPPDTSSCCFCQAAHLDFTHSPDKNRQGWPGLAEGSPLKQNDELHSPMTQPSVPLLKAATNHTGVPRAHR